MKPNHNQRFFRVSAAHMAHSGVSYAVTFPVLDVENNTIGGRGFDTFVTLDTGNGWFDGQYIGQRKVCAAARGEFVAGPDAQHGAKFGRMPSAAELAAEQDAHNAQCAASPEYAAWFASLGLDDGANVAPQTEQAYRSARRLVSGHALTILAAVHPTVSAEFKIYQQCEVGAGRAIFWTRGTVAGPDCATLEECEKSALRYLRGPDCAQVAAEPGALDAIKRGADVAIASYFTDGKPATGGKADKGRRRALGLSVQGFGKVASFPARLNDYKEPQLCDVARVLAGESVAAAMAAFNAERAAVRGRAAKRAFRQQYRELRRANKANGAPFWPQVSARVRAKSSGLFQVLKNYRAGSRYGSEVAAVRGQISADNARGVFRFVALTEAGRVAELFEFPQSWGVWMVREEIAARDEKARGRWSKSV